MKWNSQRLLFAACLLVCPWSIAAPFQATYSSGLHKEYGYAIFPCSNGGFVLIAYRDTANNRTEIIRTDSTGNVSWAVEYDSTAILEAMTETPDGGLVFAGSRIGSASGALLLKLDSNGLVQWSRSYENSRYGELVDVHVTRDGGLVTAGNVQVASVKLSFMLKTDSTGNATWRQTYTSIYQDYASRVIELPGQGYVLGCRSYTSSPDCNTYLMRTDTNGNPLWTRYYFKGGTSTDLLCDMVRTSDSGYAFAELSYIAAGSEVNLLKTDSTGHLMWQRKISGLIAIWNVLASGTNLLLCGTDAASRVVVLKVDSMGGFVSAKSYTALWGSYAYEWDACLARNGSIAMTGFSGTHYLPGSLHVHGDPFIVNIDSAGSSGCTENAMAFAFAVLPVTDNAAVIPPVASAYTDSVFSLPMSPGFWSATVCSPVEVQEKERPLIRLSPNPASRSFRIEFTGPWTGCIEVYNPMGERIYRKAVAASTLAEIRLDDAAPGLYFVKAFSQQGDFARKVILY